VKLLTKTIFASSLFLISCSEARIDQLELKMTNDLRQMREEIAQQSNAIEELRGQVGSVTGKMEEVQHSASGKNQEIEESLRKLGSRVPPPPPVPEEILNADEQLIARQQGPAAELFLSGLKQLRDGGFANSRDIFLKFVEENPDTAFTDNAYFWQGISYEGLGQLDRAVAAYSLGFQKFPMEDRVSANLFYLASVFDQMGEKKDAELTFEKLVDEHPKSDFADRAKRKLEQLRPVKAAPSKPGSKKKY
jgi:TolA-binding protein